MRCSRYGFDLAHYRELSPERRERVDRHLSRCPACAARLASYAAQDRALRALPGLRPTSVWAERVRGALQPAHAFSPGLGMARRALALVAALVLLLSAGLTTSAAALPGDLLYPLKRAQEELLLRLTTREAAESAYRDVLQVERRQEALRLLQAGRAAPVEFLGQVELRGDGALLVSGVPVQWESAKGAPLAEGDWVWVQGCTTRDAVEARQVQVLRPARSLPQSPMPAAPQRPQQQGSPTLLGPDITRSPSRTPTHPISATPHDIAQPAPPSALQGGRIETPTVGAAANGEGPKPTEAGHLSGATAPSASPAAPIQPPGAGQRPVAPEHTLQGPGPGNGGAVGASPTPAGGAHKGP